MLIETELGLGDRHMAEQIKSTRLPSGKSVPYADGNGQMTFVEQSIDPRFTEEWSSYGGWNDSAGTGYPMEKIVQVRREAKT